MKTKLFFLLILMVFIPASLGETIVNNSNITVSNYKYFTIDDSFNFAGYKYDVLIDNAYYGTFEKGDKIFYPDNSNLTIQFSNPIKTDVSDVYQTIIKPTIVTGLGVGWWIIAVFIILVTAKRIWFDSKNSYKR